MIQPDITIKLGYSLSKQTTNDRYTAIFTLVEGINHYNKEQYQAAFDSVRLATTTFKKLGDSSFITFSNLYLGKVRLNQKDTVIAEQYLNEAHLMLNKNITKIPELGEVYKLLWQINRTLNKKDNELFYLTKFIEFQESIKEEYQELSPAMILEFDTPKLVSEKEAVINSLRKKDSLKTWGLRTLLVILVFVATAAILQSILRRFYKQKLDDIIQSLENKPNEQKKSKRN